jgi:hypothetical protein
LTTYLQQKARDYGVQINQPLLEQTYGPKAQGE